MPLCKTVLMTALILPLCATWAATSEVPQPALRPTPKPTGSPVALVYGQNKIVVLKDKLPMTIFVARRPWNSAHEDSVAHFYIRAKVQDQPAWAIVPFGPEADLSYTFGTSEGADCTLRDMRLLRTPSGQLQLIIAQRELGASYVAEMPVRFDYYRLVSREPGEVLNSPDVFFEFIGTGSSHGSYCDVNIAFGAELKIGGDGIAAPKY